VEGGSTGGVTRRLAGRIDNPLLGGGIHLTFH
jgi:isoaspartyl peptidase/L-asparaginase-like protein (Ntn-hydrolase superfamily)